MAAPIALRLAVRQWLARPLRPILCSLAIAAAVALIICVGAAMDSLRFTVASAIGHALGVAEVHVRPAQRDTDARLPREMLERIRALPEVDFAAGRLSSSHIKAVLGAGDEHRFFDVIGIEPLDERLRPKNYMAGGTFSNPEAAGEIIIDGIVADVMHLKLGDEVPCGIESSPQRKMKVVGIIERPRLEILARPTVYLPLPVLAKDMGIEPQYIVIDIKLKDSAGIEDFDQYAAGLQKQLGKSVEATPGTTSKAKLADITRTLQLFLLTLSMLSGLCASLIIGTTLSVGVQERVRQFGQLRCIGASRGQLAAFLLGDAAVMLVIGQVFGILLGITLSFLLISWFPAFFQEYRLAPSSIVIALFCGGFATSIGALIPIWQVIRVPPMAAITAVASPARRSRIWLAGGIALACLLVQVILWNLPVSREVRVFGYIILGVPLIFVGWCLLAPAVIVLLEEVGAGVLGTLFHVRPSLLRHAWSRTPWRAGAMVAALMIGITLFITVRARGASLMNSWIAPRIPDLVAKSIVGGFSTQRLDRLKREHPQVLTAAPFECFTVSMNGNAGAIGQLLHQEETTFIAVNPNQFASLVDLDYLQGDRQTALAQLERGGCVFVTQEFYNTRKLGVGGKVTLRAADGSDVDFTIAAVVTSTGVEVVKNYFDLRVSFAEKAISSVLGSIADGKKYFKLGDPTLLLVTVSPDALQPEKMAALRDQLTSEGLQSLSSVELKQMLRHIIDRIMNGLSVIGLGALCVASLGVANMVIASIHARRYEFGVLRAIGAGRWQLIRLVLAEVTLIGIIAGVLGTGAGLTFAFMAARLDFVLIGFPTTFLDARPASAALYAVSLIGLAIMLTTLLAWLASFVPALRGAVAAQRTLLAAGRG